MSTIDFEAEALSEHDADLLPPEPATTSADALRVHHDIAEEKIRGAAVKAGIAVAPEPAMRAVCLTCQPSKVMTITATLPSVPACAVCGKPCTGGYWQEPEPAKGVDDRDEVCCKLHASEPVCPIHGARR